MPQAKPVPSTGPTSETSPGHEDRLAWLEVTEGAVLALPTDYPDSHKVPRHSHSRAQLLYALTGVVMVTTDAGRWMVPPEHAIWLPAGLGHAVEMLGRQPDRVSGGTIPAARIRGHHDHARRRRAIGRGL